MPELPDITLYVEALEQRIKGKPIEAIRLASPFLLRTTEPQLEEAIGREVVMLRRIGKRVAIGLEHDLWLVFHLMLAGRFSWKPAQAKLNGRHALAAFDFLNGALILTEYGARKRASLHVVESQDELAAHDPGGLEVLEADLESFCRVVRASSHRLKRTLTDPHLLSGIGNSYADEILHRARLSPMALCANLDDDALRTLFIASRHTLAEATDRLRAEINGGFPDNLDAMARCFAVHGRFRDPCPVCGTAIQRLVGRDSETNYCPRCQTGGRILADGGISRLQRGLRVQGLSDHQG